MTTPSLIVHSMQTAEVDACALLLAQIPLFAEYNLTREKAHSMLLHALDTPNNVLSTVQHEKQTVGFSWFIPKGAFGRSGYLRLIAVDPSRHGQGIGKCLINELEKTHLQPSGLMLLASEHNAQARTFYERLGYTQIGRIPDYVLPGLHECIYFKPAPSTKS